MGLGLGRAEGGGEGSRSPVRSVKPWSSVSTSRMLGLAPASLRSSAEDELSFRTAAPSQLQNIGKPM